MISVWEGLAWAIIGLLAGIVIGDPDKEVFPLERSDRNVKRDNQKTRESIKCLHE